MDAAMKTLALWLLGAYPGRTVAETHVLSIATTLAEAPDIAERVVARCREGYTDPPSDKQIRVVMRAIRAEDYAAARERNLELLPAGLTLGEFLEANPEMRERVEAIRGPLGAALREEAS